MLNEVKENMLMTNKKRGTLSSKVENMKKKKKKNPMEKSNQKKDKYLKISNSMYGLLAEQG